MFFPLPRLIGILLFASTFQVFAICGAPVSHGDYASFAIAYAACHASWASAPSPKTDQNVHCSSNYPAAPYVTFSYTTYDANRNCGTGAFTHYFSTFNVEPSEEKILGLPQSGSCTVFGPPTLDGNPVNFATGNKTQVETDYRGQGLFPLEVTRTYNSVTGLWRFNHELSIPHYIKDADEKVIKAFVERNDGKRLVYLVDGVTGNTTSDPDVRDKLHANLDGSGVVQGWTLTRFSDGLVEEYNATGQLLSATNKAGIKHLYTYPSASSIVVTRDTNQFITYTVSSGKITGFTVGGKTYSYAYSGTKLISVTYPDEDAVATNNPKRLYAYKTGTNYLEKITDENGNDYAFWSYDSSGKALASQHAGGADLTTFEYHLSDTTPYVKVTNALTKSTKYYLTTINGVGKITSVVGETSANCASSNSSYTYFTSGATKGFLESKTDSKGFITTYTRNDLGQETSRTEADGVADERLISTEWNPAINYGFNLPTKITEHGKTGEHGRMTNFTYETDGTLKTKTITDIAP